MKPLTHRIPRLLASACLLGALAGPWQATAAPAGAPGGSDPAAGVSAPIDHHCAGVEHWSVFKQACMPGLRREDNKDEVGIFVSQVLAVIVIILQATK